MLIADVIRSGGRPLLVAAAAALVIGAPSSPAPQDIRVVSAPRLRAGSPPPLPVTAWGGGEVALELTVDAAGVVTEAAKLRGTPLYTEAMAAAALTWRFDPAIGTADDRRGPVSARVLVIGVFRPPTMFWGPAPWGEVQILGEASEFIPRLTSTVPVPYPPNAVGSAVVMLEAALDPNGAARDIRVITPTCGFDGAALDAVRQWRFDPPKVRSAADPVYVYVVLGFRTPQL